MCRKYLSRLAAKNGRAEGGDLILFLSWGRPAPREADSISMQRLAATTSETTQARKAGGIRNWVGDLGGLGEPTFFPTNCRGKPAPREVDDIAVE